MPRPAIGVRLRRHKADGTLLVQVEEPLHHTHSLEQAIRMLGRAIELMAPVALLTANRTELVIDPREWDNIVVMVL